MKKSSLLLAPAIALIGALGQPAFAAERPGGRQPAAGGAEPYCTLCIVGGASVQLNGSTGSFHVDRVENRGSLLPGPLSLQVQLQSTYPDISNDMGVGEYGLSDRVPLDPLPPGGFRSNIHSGSIAFDGRKVPAGEYWMLVMLLEDPDRQERSWWVHDYVVTSDKVWCNGSSCTLNRPCSTARVAGDWGYTKTGTLFAPTGATPFATLGILSLDASGTLTGVNTGSVGGKFSMDVLKGTFEVKADCTGTTTVEVYDQFGALLRTIGMNLVVDEEATHLRGIMTSLVLPNGVSLPTVITADAKRVSRESKTGK